MKRKTKFGLSFKEALAKELLQGRVGSTALSAKHGISARYLRRLANRYEEHGSLINNSCEKAFKITCVLSVMKKRLSLSEAVTPFGIPSDSTLVHWMKLYGEFGKEGLESTKAGRQKNISVPKKKKESSVSEVSLQINNAGISGAMPQTSLETNINVFKQVFETNFLV